jgi:perosamine synthetase
VGDWGLVRKGLVVTDYIPVNEPLLTGNEKKYLNECIDSGWISSEGPFVKKFEEEFSARVGRKYGIAVCNGTAAIDAAIEACGIGPGDEIILPTFTIISCVNQILRSGATPVFVDSMADTWNMDVSTLEEKITPRTKAIMVVHIYGLPVDMDEVIRLSEKHGLIIIEDAAEAHGQTYRGRPCGSFGQLSIFSFYPNKHITTGEGGMIVTNDERLAEECSSLRNLAFVPDRRFVHDRLGWNLRMTNMQAAVGVAQLERLDEFVKIKRSMGKKYDELLSDIKSIQKPLKKTDYAENIYWVYGIVIDEDTGHTARSMERALAQVGIGTRPFFYPLHCQPVIQKMGLASSEIFPVAERMYQQGLYLPSGLALSAGQMERVADCLNVLLR